VSDEDFGRGQNTELGWNDPTFLPRLRGQRDRGSFQPSVEERHGVLRACRDRSMQFVMHDVIHRE